MTAGMHAVILSLQYIHIYCPFAGEGIAAAKALERQYRTDNRDGEATAKQRRKNVYDKERLGNSAGWNMKKQVNRTRHMAGTITS